MDKKSLVEIINSHFQDKVIVLEEPVHCVLMLRHFNEHPIGYRISIKLFGVKHTLFVSSICIPSINGAKSLFYNTISKLRNRCYFVPENSCKKVFVV